MFMFTQLLIDHFSEILKFIKTHITFYKNAINSSKTSHVKQFIIEQQFKEPIARIHFMTIFLYTWTATKNLTLSSHSSLYQTQI